MSELNLSEAKEFALQWIKENGEIFEGVADSIWKHAELGMEEYESSGLLIDLLKDHGFEVDTGVAGMPTAFVASFGNGGPVIGYNCEYDALPGLSQRAGRTEKDPIIPGAPGHGCGHNLLGTGSVMAAIAVTKVLGMYNVPGTVKVFGTPAEEICVGKPFMAKAGLFDGVDAFLDWHPWSYNMATYDTCNAYFSIRYHFEGETCHGNSPWHGKSALDSASLMGVMIEYLREHITPGNPPDASNTINYTFTDVGPEFPVVVPDKSTIWCIGRMTTAEECTSVLNRLNNCAEAAALAVGTKVRREYISVTHHKIPNQVLSRVMYDNFVALGAPSFSSEEQEFAGKLQMAGGTEALGLSEIIRPFEPTQTVLCDTSEYSWKAPYATVWIVGGPAGPGWHTWQVVASVKDGIGKKAMKKAGEVLALTAVDLFFNTECIDLAKEEFLTRLEGKTFSSLLPDDAEPPINLNADLMLKYNDLKKKWNM